MILVKLADRLHNMRTIRSMRAREAGPEGARDDGHLRAARRPHGHAVDARGAGRPRLPRAEPRGARLDHPPLHHAAARDRRRDPEDHRRHPSSSWTKAGIAGRRVRPRQEALFDLAQDAGEGPGASRASPTSTASASSPGPRPTATACSARSTSAGARCRGGSRTTSASRSRTATARSTPPSRAATASGSRCRSAPARCTRWPRPASPRTGPTATACGSENPFAVDPAKWISTLTERFETAEDHDEFLEHVKLEMYSDQVFCFTPKGEVVKLPRGATPLDFAYAIHTRIGDSCVGAKVDGDPRAALDAAQERPVGRDHHRRGPAPAGDLDRHRGDRPRQGRDPPVACARKTANASSSSAASLRAWPSSMSARRPPTRR